MQVFRIRLGLYHVFLEDWFQRFPRDQIHVLRLEDLAVNVTRELLTIYRFLGLGKPFVNSSLFFLYLFSSQEIITTVLFIMLRSDWTSVTIASLSLTSTVENLGPS